MKRFRIFIGIIVFSLVLGSFQYLAVSPSALCWGAEETKATTIKQITQNLKERGAGMGKEKLYLVAETVVEESLRYGVDYRLVLAIMKVESDYRHQVKSPDGARGLMQISPTLAKGIAKEAGIRYTGAKDLYDPRKNIRFGIYYISKLMDLFKDTTTVLFAYNVGHHKAKKLLAADKDPQTSYTKRVIAEYEKNTKKMNRITDI